MPVSYLVQAVDSSKPFIPLNRDVVSFATIMVRVFDLALRQNAAVLTPEARLAAMSDANFA